MADDRPNILFIMAVCHEVTDDLDPPVPHGPSGRYDIYPEMVAEMDRNVGKLEALNRKATAADCAGFERATGNFTTTAACST